MFSRFITWVLSHFKSQAGQIEPKTAIESATEQAPVCSHLRPQEESLKQHSLQQLRLLNKNHLDEDRKSTRLNSSHSAKSRMPSSA